MKINNKKCEENMNIYDYLEWLVGEIRERYQIEPGEALCEKSADEVFSKLDTNNKHRGMSVMDFLKIELQ